MQNFKSGFVSIVGRPNVGKSTLMNQILGEKVAITSPKPQTTRNQIRGIFTSDNAQMVFLDTPGIHKPKNKLGNQMVQTALKTLHEVDAVLFLVDNSLSIGVGDEYIINQLKNVKTPVYLVINKVDLLNPDKLKYVVSLYKQYVFFKDIIAISALNNKNIDFLLDTLADIMPKGPMYYPDNMISDQPEKAIVSERIREKILMYLNDEIPHGIAVVVESMKKRSKKDIVDIEVNIFCEREAHKAIIIGKNGRKLKGIGKSAREDIEALLGSKVFLQMWVKVKSKWRDNDRFIKNFGLSDM